MSQNPKAAFRARVRAARQGMDDAGLSRAAAGLASAGPAWVAEVAGPGPGHTVCAYVSSGSEPPTAGLLAALVDAGQHVFVPVCEPGHLLSWVRWRPGVAMARSPLAPVLEPVGERLPFAALGPVAALLLPALAADTEGVRLGQGGGYYDRFLASLEAGLPGPGAPGPIGPADAGAGVPGPAGAGAGGTRAPVPRAAVVHEGEFLRPGLLPHDALDAPVGWVIEPGGFHRCTPGAGAMGGLTGG